MENESFTGNHFNEISEVTKLFSSKSPFFHFQAKLSPTPNPSLLLTSPKDTFNLSLFIKIIKE